MAKRKPLTEAEKMSDPNLWRHWPYLPLKSKDGKKLAVLINTDLYDATKLKIAVGANVWSLSGEQLEGSAETTIEKVIADGWIGD